MLFSASSCLLVSPILVLALAWTSIAPAPATPQAGAGLRPHGGIEGDGPRWPGRYWLRVRHPGYGTVISELEVGSVPLRERLARRTGPAGL